MNTAIACTEENHMNKRTTIDAGGASALKRRLSKSSSDHAPEKRLREDKKKPSTTTNATTTTTTNGSLAAPTKPNASARPKMVTSDRIVRASQSKYRPYFTAEVGEDSIDSRGSPTGDPNLQTVLEYPGDSENFLLLRPVLKNTSSNRTPQAVEDVEDKDEYNPITDLIRSAYFIYESYLTPEQQELLGDESQGIMRNLNKHRNRRNAAGFIEAVNDFNRVIRDLKAKGELSKNAKAMRHPSYDLACHILYQVYSRTVAPQADALNNYQAFSNNVYGEINPVLVKDFISKTKVNSHSVFMDMGCGIGNVVLQVAAQTGCEAYGIEIMEVPCKCAKRQLKEYAARMKAWRLPTGKIHFRHGDFLDVGSSDMYQTLKRADVLLVNNYAFDMETNHKLAQLFLDLKEGTKIISLKSFVPKTHKINQRTFDKPESILRVEEFEYFSEAVSWTNNGGTYYIATVDRSRLKPFYEGMYPST
ncbi:histone methylation protein DOT1-domain-containing protein [Zychaea mexicana]|uniref:histone methylation protein DOT1-domain-containing protein n=1 Tax=Zychaea mexicana TaxID=64656 RepID=UPI0022FE43F8|nr:histone methylation protein DOT1-domain-containing protein [Zychaea mexicana]KAI9499412.1 histone methylation protein DOT1-domain-containing protein [Zychaea mexicana]